MKISHGSRITLRNLKSLLYESMSDLIINGIDFNDRLDKAKAELLVTIEYNYHLQKWWFYTKNYGIHFIYKPELNLNEQSLYRQCSNW